MKIPGFCGGSCPEASLNADAERTRNLYPHAIGGGTPPNNPILYKIPGLAAFSQMGGASTRGCLEINGRGFVVAGTSLYEVDDTGAATALGTVVDDDRPATLSSNGQPGHQLFVVSGGSGYIFDLDSSVFTTIGGDFPTGDAKMGGFIDGYFVVLRDSDGAFQISALEDGLTWDALDVGIVSTSSDKVQSLLVHDRQIWLFGGSTTSIWYNTGDADFPFAPVNNVLDQGIISPWSAQRIDNTVMWRGKNEHGAGCLYRAQGGVPVRVSTHAIEYIWSFYRDPGNAVAYVEQWNGHTFYHLLDRSADDVDDNDNAVSWVYDVSTNLWHERARWDATNGLWHPMVGSCHMHVFGTHLIGDYRIGALYEQRATLYDLEIAVVA